MGAETGSEAAMVTAVPTKGGGSSFIFNKCLDFMQENGDKDLTMVVQTDQESSVKYLTDAIIQGRLKKRPDPEESPIRRMAGENAGSNGVVGSKVKGVEERIGALLLG